MAFQKIGTEFIVNQTPGGSQSAPAIATDANGNFIISWHGYNDGSLKIYARFFDRNGIPLSNDIAGNPRVSNNQAFSDVAADANGNFVLAWHQDSSTTVDHDIVARRFSANGNSLDASEAPVNSFRPGGQFHPSIAMNKQGTYVVVWENDQPDQTGAYGIYAQVFSANGSPINGNIPIDISFDRLQADPVVAMREDGSFVVAWEEPSTQTGNTEIYARRYGANGTPLGSPFRINEVTQGSQNSPAIATTPDGGFLVAWYGGTNDDIFVRRFDASGRPLTGDILVNTFIPNGQIYTAIAVDNFGNFVVVWESEDQDQSDECIYARRFRADGTPLSEELLVNTTTIGYQGVPDIAMQPNGDFIITWQGDNPSNDAGDDIYAQRFQIASQVAFEQAAVQVNEGGQAVLTLNRLNDLQLTSQVQVDVVGGFATPGIDYTFTPQTITFNPGEAQKTVVIPILQDNFTEANETIQLSITGGDRVVAGDQATTTVTILNAALPAPDSDPLVPATPSGNTVGTSPLPAVDGSVVNSGAEVPSRVGSNRNDRLTGTDADEVLVGLRGSDRLNAGSGNDILIGVDANSRRPGRNEIDQMNGGQGNDIFVLGDENRVFYDDSKRANPGVKDYALIQKFNRKQDTIQLNGDAADYRLGSGSGVRGTGLYLETGKTDELIAVIQGGGKLNLNSSAFEYVG
jgi:Ca2+-binding RTX toxin-like protein